MNEDYTLPPRGELPSSMRQPMPNIPHMSAEQVAALAASLEAPTPELAATPHPTPGYQNALNTQPAVEVEFIPTLLPLHRTPPTPPVETTPSAAPIPPLNIAWLLDQMIERKASDMYLTYNCPPALRIDGEINPLPMPRLNDQDIFTCLSNLLNPSDLNEFTRKWEFNSAIQWNERARFRINAYKQQLHNALVIRRIQTDIPSPQELGLPKAYTDLIMQKRGLVLVVGPTGSGKSTSLAAMVDYRNVYGNDHIMTIEDPVEYLHFHKNCIISQRDVGIDTVSYGAALKNALRQQPDVILIGEIRDRETMEHAISFAETGHLCVCTLHANNANQTIERVLNFFPEERHKQILINLSLNLRGIISQRLVPNTQGKRALASEIMLNEGVIKQYIHEGRINELKDTIANNRDYGMQTMDQCLHELYLHGTITEETALAYADNPANLRLKIVHGSGIKPAELGFAVPTMTTKPQAEF